MEGFWQLDGIEAYRKHLAQLKRHAWLRSMIHAGRLPVPSSENKELDYPELEVGPPYPLLVSISIPRLPGPAAIEVTTRLLIHGHV